MIRKIIVECDECGEEYEVENEDEIITCVYCGVDLCSDCTWENDEGEPCCYECFLENEPIEDD